MQTKRTVLLSTAYLGPVEYFASIAKSGKAIIDPFEHYVKQTYRNRCRIMSANGILPLSIPVIKISGNHTRVRDIEIDHSHKWQRVHWRAITSAYSHSPFFLYYKDELEIFYEEKTDNLLEFNTQLTIVIMRLVGINTPLEFSDSYMEKDPGGCFDMRDRIHPKKEDPEGKYTEYIQVFHNKFPFSPNLSIIDLLFNEGPQAKDYLLRID